MKWLLIKLILICLFFNYTLSFGFLNLFMRRNNTMMNNMMMTKMNNTNQSEKMSKKTKCLNPPRTAKKVEMNIKNCQEDVKNKIVKEAFDILHEQFEYEHEIENLHKDKENMFNDFHKDHNHEEEYIHSSHEHEFDASSILHGSHEQYDRYEHMITKRSFTYHPTLVRNEDKRLAGCLLHCIYAKNNAVDKLGWPTLDGLVDFYSEGVNEHGFFMTTLRAVNLCLNAATYKYHVNRHQSPEKGESCDLAFDVFDCISDQITAYCLDHYNHE